MVGVVDKAHFTRLLRVFINEDSRRRNLAKLCKMAVELRVGPLPRHSLNVQVGVAQQGVLLASGSHAHRGAIEDAAVQVVHAFFTVDGRLKVDKRIAALCATHKSMHHGAHCNGHCRERQREMEIQSVFVWTVNVEE